MINEHLVWFLKSSAFITEAQSGFWKNRSTMIRLVLFEQQHHQMYKKWCKSLFLDDFSVSYRSKHMPAIERHLQLHLNRIEDTGLITMVLNSPVKDCFVHFCQRKDLHPDTYLFFMITPFL